MKARYYLLTLLYCAGIFYLSSKSRPVPFESPFPGADKVIHMTLYGGLCAVVSIGIHRSNTVVKPSIAFFVPVLFTLFYGVTDELHQIFVPHRSFDPADLVADAAGAVLAQVVLFLWWRRKGSAVSSRRQRPTT